MAHHNKLNPEELDFIRQNAEKGAKFIAHALNRHKMTIGRWARKNKIKLSKPFAKSNRINHDFFKVQSPEMAYVLGFIAADGCIMEGQRGGRKLEIGLAKKDVLYLEKITKLMGFTGKLHFKERTQSYTFAIGSRIIFDDLLFYNITPRKSLTLKWPDKLEEKYYPDFIRGYFDGDGSCRIQEGYVDRTNTALPTLEFSILGTLEFLSDLKTYINRVNNNNFGGIEFLRQFNVYRLTFGGTETAEDFGKIIYYSDNLIKLERKHNRYKKWLEIKGKRWTHEDYDKLKEELKYE